MLWSWPSSGLDFSSALVVASPPPLFAVHPHREDPTVAPPVRLPGPPSPNLQHHPSRRWGTEWPGTKATAPRPQHQVGSTTRATQGGRRSSIRCPGSGDRTTNDLVRCELPRNASGTGQWKPGGIPVWPRVVLPPRTFSVNDGAVARVANDPCEARAFHCRLGVLLLFATAHKHGGNGGRRRRRENAGCAPGITRYEK